jgi:hypothetical protein
MAVTSTLSAALNATDTTLSITDGSIFPSPELRVWIDAEALTIGDGPPASNTWTIIRDVLSTVAFAHDDFDNRELTAHWGTTADGDQWVRDTAAQCSVAGGLGLITLPSAGTNENPRLFGQVKQDVRVTFRFATDKLAAGDRLELAPVARSLTGYSPETYYRVDVRLNTDQTIGLRTAKVVADVDTQLVAETASAETHAAGAFYRVALEVYGSSPTTIRAKVWADGADEPGSWLVSSTDSEASLQAVQGYVGVRPRLPAGVSNAPVVFSIDNFAASEIPQGVSHSNGATVKLIENGWTAGVMRVGYGAPDAYGENGAEWLDLTNNRTYWMVSGTWRYATLT